MLRKINWKDCLGKEGLAPLLLVLGLAYFFSAKGLVEISDTDYSLRTAKALLEEGSFLIEAPDPAIAEISKVTVDGKIYSKFGIGLVAIFLPIVVAAKAMALLPGVQETQATGFLVSFYNLPFALVALYFFHRICRQLGAGERAACLVTLVLGAGTYFWKYTVTDYSEVTQLCFLLGTIFYIFRSDDGDMVKASLLFSGLFLLKLVNVIIWGPLALYLLLRHGFGVPGLRKVAAFASVVFVTGLFLLLYNYLRFGSPLSTGYEDAGPMFTMEYFKRDILGFFTSPQRGLFHYNPILLAALLFWPAFLRKFPKEGICFILIAAGWTTVMASWASYQGGWAWGNRLLLNLIPLTLLPLAFVSLDKTWKAAAVIGLFLFSFYIQLVSVFQHTHEYYVILRDMEADPLVAPHLRGMPPQFAGNAALLHQKLAGVSGEYPYSAFLGGSMPTELASKSIFTQQYDSYQGLHAWPFHLATFLGQPILRWLLVGILPCLALICYHIYKFAWPPGVSRPASTPD